LIAFLFKLDFGRTSRAKLFFFSLLPSVFSASKKLHLGNHINGTWMEHVCCVNQIARSVVEVTCLSFYIIKKGRNRFSLLRERLYRKDESLVWEIRVFPACLLFPYLSLSLYHSLTKRRTDSRESSLSSWSTFYVLQTKVLKTITVVKIESSSEWMSTTFSHACHFICEGKEDRRRGEESGSWVTPLIVKYHLLLSQLTLWQELIKSNVRLSHVVCLYLVFVSLDQM
jgi:hypothetical protein